MSNEQLGIQVEEMLDKVVQGIEYTPEQFADLILRLMDSTKQDPLGIAKADVQRLVVACGRYASREIHQFTVYLKDRSNFAIYGFDEPNALSRANISLNLSQKIQEIRPVKTRRKRKS